MNYINVFNEEIDKHLLVVENSKKELIESLNQSIPLILGTLKKKKKILIFGNGGSASDSIHFAAELSGKFKNLKRRPLPAISLAENLSSITAIGNDFSFEEIFSRQVKAFGKLGDLAIGISTSGKSKNVILGLKEARKNKLKTISLTGKFEKYLKPHSDVVLKVNSNDTARIQELHILVIHLICTIIDATL